MGQSFEDVTIFGKKAFDTGLKSAAAFSKGTQAIVAETTDYAKKSFEHSTSAWQRLISAKSFEKAVEIQTSHAKASYETLVAEMTKLGSLYTDLTRDAYKPFEDALVKAK